ncbi:MAG TPA: hypothetical protein VMS35_01540, partial [Nitrososphaeraceae archaeon]|nr:hypothetical protein [Nitrososphaeraceae archaeon]
MTSQRQIVNTKLVIFNIIFLTLISFLVSTYNIFYIQTVSGAEANTTITNTISSQKLDTIMSQISNSDKPEDIATLAYIWGYPLITIERSFNYFTNPNTPNVPGQGPANELNCAKELVTANFTDVVLPNE